MASAVYALILLGALATILLMKQLEWRATAWGVLGALGIMSGGAALWFIGLQLLVVRRWCSYCTTAHAFGLGISIVVLLGASQSPPPPLLQRVPFWVVSTAGLLMFAGGQLVLHPKLYEVVRAEPAPDLPACAAPAVPGPAEAAITISTAPICVTPADDAAEYSSRVRRDVKLVAGRVVLRVGQWPMVGAAAAPYVIACLFDYTCRGCRGVHRLLEQAVEHHAPRLSVLTVPVPQDPACNAYVAAAAGRTGACDYARLGLAIWTHASRSYSSFARWLFESELPPPIEAVVAMAGRFVPSVDLDQLSMDVAMGRLIDQGLAAHRAAGTHRLPTLLLPQATVSGEIPSLKHLTSILDKELFSAVPSRSMFSTLHI
jgi:hypothetical protein